MFSKSVVLLRSLKPLELRLAHHIASKQGSYLKNNGSEPLINATLGDILANIAHKYPDRVAIKSIHEELTITYEELINKVDSLGCALRAMGFEKGDRLGLWTHSCTQWVVTFFAAFRAGIIPVLLNPLYEKPELIYSIKKTNLKGILSGETIKKRNYNTMLYEIIPELNTSNRGALKSAEFPSLTSIITAGNEKLNGILNMDSLIRNYQNNSEISKYGNEIKPEDGSLILLTSGSTGKPKAVLDSQLAVVNNTYFSGIRSGFNMGKQIVCSQAPLFHALGSLSSLVAALQHGSTVVFPSPAYNPSASLHALCAEKCTAILGTPTMYVDILTKVRGKGNLPINLNMASVAGSPCSPELMRKINKQLNVKSVRAIYGLTETTAGVFQSMTTDSLELVSETVGYISDHMEAKVVDSDGNTVPFGSPGELMLRGYSNMMRYWNDPIKTAETITEDGWLNTGDTFALLPDGYGKVVGRIKDIIIRGGENIAPKEIEDSINTHPDIIESQVIGVSDERLGEELCAVVRIADGATFTLEDLKKHCTGKIAYIALMKRESLVALFQKEGSELARNSMKSARNIMSKLKCTAILGTPTMYVDILTKVRGKGNLPINLNMASVAGSPCSPELMRKINKQLNVKSVRAMYGLTETTGGVFQSMTTDSLELVSETVGYISDHMEAKHTSLRGYSNMMRYWNDPIKTAETITEDGWLNTGDTFALLPDGYGKVVGRIKDIIIRGGENIAPKEIEDSINTHPDIIESQVIGVSDERLGEELCAVVRIADGATFTLEDLKKHCTGKIVKFKIPKILRVINEFPKTNSGKVQKFRVKELVESGTI